jgi:hypothetical protein
MRDYTVISYLTLVWLTELKNSYLIDPDARIA